MQYFSKPQEHAVEPSPAPEDSWPSRNRVAIRDINRAHELTTQLQAVLLQLPAGSTWSQVGGDIIKDILKLTASALSALQSSGALADQKRKEPDGRKRSRRKEEKWEVVTTVPYEDGHLWRKYGQKAINNAEHPRSYFRCTYKEEQGCEAKKTVQQEDGHADPPKFSVEYTIRHTCKLSESASFFPFQKPSDLTPISGLTSSSSTSSSPSLAAPAAGSAKGDDQSPENGISNGDLDLPQEGTQVPDEMLDDWDRLLDDLLGRTTQELDMFFGDDCHEWH